MRPSPSRRPRWSRAARSLILGCGLLLGCRSPATIATAGGGAPCGGAATGRADPGCGAGTGSGATAGEPALVFPDSAALGGARLDEAMRALARSLLEGEPGAVAGAAPGAAPGATAVDALDRRFRAQLVAGRPAEAAVSLAALRAARRGSDPILADGGLVVFEIYARARQHEAAGAPFPAAFQRAFRAALGPLDDKAAYYVLSFVRDDLQAQRGAVERALAAPRPLSRADAGALVASYLSYGMYEATRGLWPALIDEDDRRRYAVDDGLVIQTPRAQLAALVMRPRRVERGPAALFFTIYTDASRGAAREAAAHGYVGVAVETRGKRLTAHEVRPYEHEAEDTYDAIEWISHQPWSDGQVGMWGNSYVGFAAWAATKRLHPALKTIVPSAAAIPGLGLPMENNVFLNANYAWAFYVSNTRLLDDATYRDPRWRALNRRWYESGRPYRELDQVDGTPNPALQRWLQHPAYDAYWQAMVPYQSDYAKIGIPVLTITGYYDDGQISALHYLREHVRYRPNAEHYLLIGPYQHFSAQAARKPAMVDGYAIDPVAQINTKAIIFQWMDHVMRGGARPAILADKVNYQVMGGDVWRHAPSLAAMAREVRTLYLSPTQVAVPAPAPASAANAGYHTLTAARPSRPSRPSAAGAAEFVEQTVDLADRTAMVGAHYYPSPVVATELSLGTAAAYLSEPFTAPASVDGALTGELRVSVNRRDLDFTVVLYEILPDGRAFHLSYYLGRASFAKDMAKRELLTPGVVTTIPFERSRLVSRQLSVGSRLLVVVSLAMHPFAQVNHGTGKDVSDESIADAAPLTVRWYADSFVRIPLGP